MNDLRETLELIRVREYADDIDALLIQQLIDAQEAFMERPAEVAKQLDEAVEAYMRRQESKHA